MPKSMQEIVDFYTPYLCGVLDLLALLRDTQLAVDYKETLAEIVLSIARDAVAAAQEKKA